MNTKGLVTCQEARSENEDKRPQELRQRLELVKTNARGVTGEQQVRACDSHEEEPEEQEEAARVHARKGEDLSELTNSKLVVSLRYLHMSPITTLSILLQPFDGRTLKIRGQTDHCQKKLKGRSTHN